MLEVGKKISLAEADALKKEKGKRNWAILKQEYKSMSENKLVGYMKEQKSIRRKLNRQFSRSKRQEAARVINLQVQTDASSSSMLNKNREINRLR